MNTIAYSTDSYIKTQTRRASGPSSTKTGYPKRRSPVLSRRELRRVILELLG